MQNHFLLLKLSLFNFAGFACEYVRPCSELKLAPVQSLRSNIPPPALAGGMEQPDILFETARFELYKINLYKAEIGLRPGFAGGRG